MSTKTLGPATVEMLKEIHTQLNALNEEEQEARNALHYIQGKRDALDKLRLRLENNVVDLDK